MTEESNRVSLSQLIDTKLNALERLLCLKVAALEKETETRLKELAAATKLAADTLEKRLEGMNEFRAQLNAQTRTFVSRTELESFKKLIDADIRVLREAKAEAAGKASRQAVNISTILAILGLLLGIAGILVKVI